MTGRCRLWQHAVFHNGDGSRLETTSEPPFFVSGLGWVPAGRLSIGNTIVTRAGPKATEQTSTVAKVEAQVGRIRVYILNVADLNTFFVQDAHQKGLPKWVHNGCNLIEIAEEVHSVLPVGAQDYRTTAAVRAWTGKSFETVVASNRTYLSRPQQAVAEAYGAICASGKGHAELTAIRYARSRGWKVISVAASRPICGECWVTIKDIGAFVLTVRR
ncbi:MAG: polymorphic toxin-type HINT domain-containing protein [Capsulimonadales bacterium]|nr:polymorphic toxin-type HINT domain-containing protein [Capsulimonadales bacterium]